MEYSPCCPEVTPVHEPLNTMRLATSIAAGFVVVLLNEMVLSGEMLRLLAQLDSSWILIFAYLVIIDSINTLVNISHPWWTTCKYRAHRVDLTWKLFFRSVRLKHVVLQPSYDWCGPRLSSRAILYKIYSLMYWNLVKQTRYSWRWRLKLSVSPPQKTAWGLR